MLAYESGRSPLLIGIAIVNYKKADRLSAGIKSIQRQEFSGKIFVSIIENSIDDSQAELIRVCISDIESFNLLETTENLGYSKGMNVAAHSLLESDYLLLMSPDIILEDFNIVSTLVERMEGSPDIGILATTQLNDDGSTVEVARRFPSLGKQMARRLSRGRLYQDTELLLDNVRDCNVVPVDWVQSSFCLVRTKLWTTLNGFDERFFVFMADADLSRRALRLGWKTAVTRVAGVRADGVRASTGGLLSVIYKRSMQIHVADALRYYFYSARQ